MQEALSCPCVDDIKSGPCGTSFVNAFSCYMKCQARQQVGAKLPSCTAHCHLPSCSKSLV